MLTQIFLAVFLVSLAGGGLTLLLALMKPITKRCFSSKWHYYIWLTVLIVLMLPVRFHLPAIVPTESYFPAANVQTQQQSAAPEATVPAATAITVPPPKPSPTFSSVRETAAGLLPVISLLWLVGAVVLFAGKSGAYLLLLYKIRRTTKVVPCPELKIFTDKAVTVRTGGGFHAPFLIGLLRPTLILPQMPLTQEQKSNILRHEMTHLRRRDLYYKWLAFVIGCLHWFNPAVYYVTRQINEACEISCDLAVTDTMNTAEKTSYMNTILTVLACQKGQSAFLCTGMTSGKKQIERRFFMIKNKKTTSKFISILSVIVALAMLSTTIFASGVLSGLSETNDTIEITNNGRKIELINKPFIENGEVYLPLRETFERLGVMDHAGTYISWDNGKIEVFFGYDSNGTAVKMDDRFEMEIGKKYLFYNPSNDLPNSDASRDMDYAPLLAGQTTYVPYSFISCMFTGGEWDIKYTIYEKGGIEYTNHALGFSLKLPTNWEGKYTVEDTGPMIAFQQSATNKKYGGGTLFYIERVSGQKTQEQISTPGNRKVVMYANGYTYVLGTPTDVQYPIWIDRDEEDITIADEYEDMFKDIEKIGQSIKPTEVSDTSIISTIDTFFSAFAQRDFESMKQYCTANCIQDFFGDGYVFGMTQASLINLHIDPLEYAKSSNSFVAQVGVEMQPSPGSVYLPDQTATSFFLILLRQEDGSYRIDEFATGL